MNNKQLKPRQVPFGWTLKRISDVARTGSGGTPLSTKKEFYNGGEIPWINSGEVGQSIIKTTNNYITGLGLKNSSAKIFPRGSVLVAMYGATAGRASLLDFDASTNQAICAIMPKKGYDAKFIKYYFDVLYHYLVGVSTGSARDNLNQNGLQDIEIPFPSESVQKSIAKILSDLDAKIELNNKINRELEAMAKTLYDYWFVQFDFPNADGKPYKSSGGKMVYNAELKREIPEGWEAGTLGKIAELIRGVTYDSSEIKDENDEDTVPVLRATNITGNVLDLDNMVYVPRQNVSKIQLLNRLDILITMSSGSKEHIGKNGFYYFDKEVSFGAFCAKIVAKKDFRYYLYSYTQSEFMFATIKNECLGTNINNLNGSLVKGFKLVLPPIDLIKKFNEKVQSIYETIGNNHKQNQHLTALRDWLLPMLMNGQVTVKQAEEKLNMAAEPSVKYGS